MIIMDENICRNIYGLYELYIDKNKIMPDFPFPDIPERPWPDNEPEDFTYEHT
jgi:hypothetical protein